MVNLIVGGHALRVEAFVMRQPDERREELWAWLLQRNARMYVVAFAIDKAGDVYLTGRVPLHASVARTGAGTPLLAGPGGVGKSTVLVGLLADGAAATADNLCCADRSLCFGLVEPLRTDAVPGGPVLSAAGAGARTSHGRTEWPLTARVPVLAPDRIVVLERGVHTEISPIPAAEAARTLVAGTYAAGELRRYWAFAATLALATGRGPAHPPVAEVAADHAGRLPCVRVRVGDGDSFTAAQLCGENP